MFAPGYFDFQAL